MMKTAKNIERDIYNIVLNSELGDAVKGAIYRKGMRPKDAKTEDAVVKFLAGLNTQVQHGVVIVNIYIPDIKVAGRSEKLENIQRVEFFQSLVNDLFENIENEEYEFELDGTPTSFEAGDIKQHFVNVRLNFKRITN